MVQIFHHEIRPVTPSKLHPCHLERGGGGLLVDLGGMMHPLSNHDMAKLVSAAGWRVEPPLTREAMQPRISA
jgi:hypothetical protein